MKLHLSKYVLLFIFFQAVSGSEISHQHMHHRINQQNNQVLPSVKTTSIEGLHRSLQSSGSRSDGGGNKDSNLHIYINNEITELATILSYGRGQDISNVNMTSLEVSSDGSQVSLHGNSWKAFPLEEGFEIKENTVLEFDFHLVTEAESHLICLDDVRGDTGDSHDNVYIDRCFWLAGTMTTEQCMTATSSYTCQWHLFTEETITEGDTLHYVIPVGHFTAYFLNRKINYIAFVSDNDEIRTAGASTFSNIKVIDDLEAPSLNILINGVSEVLEFGGSYGPNQDNQGLNPYMVSADNLSVTLRSNSWKYFELSRTYRISGETVLEFDFSLVEETETHAICLDNDRRHASINGLSNRCFWLAGNQVLHNLHLYVDNPNENEPMDEGGTKHCIIHLGHFGYFYNVEINYVALISDNASGREGISTFSNFQLKDDMADQSLNITINGISDALPLGGPYGIGQDNQDIDPYILSSDSTEITLNGNSWKAFELGEEYTVKANTVLEFDFSLVEEAESHLICLDTTLGNIGRTDTYGVNVYYNDFVRSCFWLAGTTTTETCFLFDDLFNLWRTFGCEWNLIVDQVIYEGETMHYRIPLEEFSHREIKYIAFIVDSDNDWKRGMSTFRKIVLKDDCQTSSDCARNHECIVNGEGGYCICPDNYYGPTCDVYCDNTTCDNGGECNVVGSCMCKEPWAGETCMECMPGMYGDNCTVQCGVDNCPDGTCDPDGNCCESICENGGAFVAGSSSGCECLCIGPWTGHSCAECPQNQHGENLHGENCEVIVLESGIPSAPISLSEGSHQTYMLAVVPSTRVTCIIEPTDSWNIGDAVLVLRFDQEPEVDYGLFYDYTGYWDCFSDTHLSSEESCRLDVPEGVSSVWASIYPAEFDIVDRVIITCTIGLHCGPDNCFQGSCDQDGYCVPCEKNCDNGGVLASDLGCECICALPWDGETCTECIPNHYGEDCSVECSPYTCPNGVCDGVTGSCIPYFTSEQEEIETTEPEIETPETETIEIFTTMNTPVTVPLQAGLGEVDRDAVEIVKHPSNGKVTVEDDGRITYLPNNGFEGLDTFAAQVCYDEYYDYCLRMNFQVNVLKEEKSREGLYALISLVLAPLLCFFQEPLRRCFDKVCGSGGSKHQDLTQNAASSSNISAAV